MSRHLPLYKPLTFHCLPSRPCPYFFLWHSRHFTGAGPPLCLWQSMHVPVAALGSWNAAWRLVFKGGAAGIVWQSRQAWFSEASGFCGRLGWWQDVQAMPRLPVWFSWSKVTAPSFAGSVILSLGRCAAGRTGAASCGAAGFSACVVGGGAEVAVTGGGGVVVVAAGDGATAAASVAAAPSVGDAA